MPLYSVYSMALEQDLEQSAGVQQASVTLQSQTFIQVGLNPFPSHAHASGPLQFVYHVDGRRIGGMCFGHVFFFTLPDRFLCLLSS